MRITPLPQQGSTIIVGDEHVIRDVAQVDAGATALIEFGSQHFRARIHGAIEITPTAVVSREMDMRGAHLWRDNGGLQNRASVGSIPSLGAKHHSVLAAFEDLGARVGSPCV